MVDERRFQEVLDRQDILDCIHRYCRGVDRFDRELILSAYHHDAIDFHGPFKGGPEEFVDWVMKFHGTKQYRHHHLILNHSVDLKEDTAHTETYWMCVGVFKEGEEHPITIAGGRYVDRFERQNGRWGIVSRVCLVEWRTKQDMIPLMPEFVVGCRDKSDISYLRPLDASKEIAANQGA